MAIMAAVAATGLQSEIWLDFNCFYFSVASWQLHYCIHAASRRVGFNTQPQKHIRTPEVA